MAKYLRAKDRMESIKDSTDLLLVGRTGNGKSALGNTILQKRSFKSKRSTESVPRTKPAYDFDFNNVKGRVIKVVDGPRVGDTDLDPREAAELIEEAMSVFNYTSTNSFFHAILLVLRYGVRFTKEDVQTLDTLKKIFGDKFVTDHTILVLTCGDLFSSDREDSGQTFEAWCAEQGGVFRELFTSVQKRAVLFDNKTKDKEIIADQLNQLLSLVDTLGARYTPEIFKDAKKTRYRLLIAEKRPTLSEDAIKEAGVITQLLGRVDFKKPAEGIRQLEQVMKRADDLLENVLEQDQGTNSLSVAKKIVQYTKTTIAEQLEEMKSLFDKMKEEEEKEEIIRRAEADNQAVKLKALQLEKDLARIREKQEAEQRGSQEAANEKRREEEQPTENSEQNTTAIYEDAKKTRKHDICLKQGQGKNLTDPEMDSTDLLLVGKTGNGKSALGNTILQQKKFKSENSTESVTKSADFDFCDFKGRVIKVVDGPGVGDTDLDPKEAAKLVVDAMSEAMCTSTEGFHAILLVVRYGIRFTREDVETLDTLKKVFGEKFVSDHAILVLTCGDNFRSDSEDSGQTFEAWCAEQEGFFRELFTSVQKRAVLFDNRTKDEEIIADQLHPLLSLVDTLGARYTPEIFKDAKKTRNSLLIAEKRPTLSEDDIKEARVITQLLGRVDFKKPAEGIHQLEKLMERADALLENVLEQDQGTNSLSEAKKLVQYTKTTIAEQLEEMQSLFDKMKDEEQFQEKEEVIRQAEADNQAATEVKLKALQHQKDLARIREKQEAEQRERQEAENEERRKDEQPTENSVQNEVKLREKKHLHESEKQEEQKEAVKISVDQLAAEREKNLQVKVASLQDQYRDVKEETRTNWLKAAPLMFPKLWAKVTGGRQSCGATESQFYA